jgi:tRNA (guanine10-N2)-dimethyltransferase
MKLLFELSQEHPELPQAEVLACLDSEGIKYEFDNGISKSLLGINIELDQNSKEFKGILDRLSLCFSITLELFTSEDLTDVENYANEFKLDHGNTFCITAKRLGNGHPELILPELEREIGALISKKYNVDLEHPDRELKLIVGDKFYFGVNLHHIDRKSFETRVPQNRPYFSPVSLHPKYARALVNLGRIQPGDIILDPFCGTGGILIEAGLIGIEVIGSDISENMVEGCKKNLEWAGLSNFSIFQSDVGDIDEVIDDPGYIDAVVTEPPYGRAATTGGENLEDLYERAFASFHSILLPEKYLVISVPKKKLIEPAEKYFDLIHVYSMRVHKSLDKHFCVLVNR